MCSRPVYKTKATREPVRRTSPETRVIMLETQDDTRTSQNPYTTKKEQGVLPGPLPGPTSGARPGQPV